MSSKINNFKEIISSLETKEMLEIAKATLDDYIYIYNAKEQINKIEAGFADNGKAIFVYMVHNLEQNEIIDAANFVKGKLRIFREKEEAAAQDKIQKEKDNEILIPTDDGKI